MLVFVITRDEKGYCFEGRNKKNAVDVFVCTKKTLLLQDV
jgi:hypothetical protein